MSPGCCSLAGCRILRLDFAASGTPSPYWWGETSRRHSREGGNPQSHGSPIESGTTQPWSVPQQPANPVKVVTGRAAERGQEEDTGARRAPVSGGHERSRLARRRLDRCALIKRSLSARRYQALTDPTAACSIRLTYSQRSPVQRLQMPLATRQPPPAHGWLQRRAFRRPCRCCHPCSAGKGPGRQTE